MKFFVAGILIDNNEYLDANACETLIQSLPIIAQDAKRKIGDDTIIIIVLHEYAFTPISICDSNKRQTINKLRKALESYDNIILIPGSFASHQLLKEKPNKKEEIKGHYSLLRQYKFFKSKKVFQNEYDHFKSNIEDSDVYYLQNSTYILTKDHKCKHKKSSPYHEQEKLMLPIDHVFDIGVETLPRRIQVGGQEIDIRVLVCLEHHLIDEIKNLNVEPPLVEVIVSDSTTRRQQNLYGALCIQMDSDSNLYVGVNTAHHKASGIEIIKAGYYTVSSSIEEDVYTVKIVDTPIDYFEMQIREISPGSNRPDMSQCLHGFFNSKQSIKPIELVENPAHESNTACLMRT